MFSMPLLKFRDVYIDPAACVVKVCQIMRVEFFLELSIDI